MAKAPSNRGKKHDGDRSTDRQFGDVLRHARLDRGMTQEQLAWITGVERAFISELERGVKGASINMLFKLAKGLEIRASELIVAVEKGAN